MARALHSPRNSLFPVRCRRFARGEFAIRHFLSSLVHPPSFFAPRALMPFSPLPPPHQTDLSYWSHLSDPSPYRPKLLHHPPTEARFTKQMLFLPPLDISLK